MPATTAKSPSAQLLEAQTAEYVDMRKSIDGLAALIEQETKLNPFDAWLFVFCNRRQNKIKLLYWEKNGFVLWYKRLEKFRFKWPGRMIPDYQWRAAYISCWMAMIFARESLIRL